MQEFDVVVAGDFRFPGGTSAATAHEIKALAAAGYRIGLCHVKAPVLRQRRGLHPQIRDCINQRLAEMIPTGTPGPVHAALGIFHNPLAFSKPVERFPRLSIDNAIVVAHQPAEDANGIPYYDTSTVDAVCTDLARRRPWWVPISPVVRDSLLRSNGVNVHGTDWHNTLFTEEWSSPRPAPLKDIPIIGRHSRSDKEKWPATRADILAVYPNDPTIEVRLLGVGDFVARTMGTFPQNWCTYRFGEVDPPQFLRGIDFFIYYHHPHWIEAFGRNIAEAMASGAVAILPFHFKPIFEDAAVYALEKDAVAMARELHGDWGRYRLQSAHAARWVKENHGPERHVKFIRELGANPSGRNARAATRRSLERGDSFQAGKPIQAPVARADFYDVITIGDMRTPNDRPIRMAHEVRIQAAHGYKSGLIHVPTKAVASEFVRSEMDACLLAGMATLLTTKSRVQARLVVLHGAEDLFEPVPSAFPAVEADRIIVVVDRSLSQSVLHRTHRLLSIVFRTSPVWVPIAPDIREALLKAWADVPIEVDNWTASLAATPWRQRKFRADRPVVGVVLPDSKGEPSAEDKALVQDLSSFYVRVLRPEAHEDKVLQNRVEWFCPSEISSSKFLDRTDFLVIAESTGPQGLPRMLLAEAMARGSVPIVAPAAARELGPGVLGADRAKIREIIAKAWEEKGLTDLELAAGRVARSAYPNSVHVSRVERLTGRPPSFRLSTRRPRRVAFVSSNGVGLGHLTRLLSIARRLPAEIEPTFITMSQAYGLAEQFGYATEYIPFHTQSESSSNRDWNDWFRLQFDQLMDYYDVAGVVFDGGAPYAGLVEAVSCRVDVFSVWIRRGMWRSQQFNEPLIRRQKFFDLIIEPRDIADIKDEGMTAPHRGRVAQVDPIRLLDDDDLLSREHAANELGIDPNRPAVLIQLGSGATRDIVGITREAIAACAAFDKLQVVLIEWSIGVVSFDSWPGVKVLKGFPTSRYFKAFDFTIAAAGYNSYNEIISFGLPAIFVANDAPMMDDQGGRAAFAEEQGASFSIQENHIARDLPGLVATILDPRTREVMRVNCLRIALPNGAPEAAEWIASLHQTSDSSPALAADGATLLAASP